MKTVSDLEEWRRVRAGINGSIGFVPTMGDLHAGHDALVRRARRENDILVASVFVNPTQFNQTSDFEKYARTLKEDQALLTAAGTDYLFAPDAKDMYPDGYDVQVVENVIAAELEGAFRPGHFTGVLTVVNKLFNLVQPTRAYFGEKDFQQLLLIRKMVEALFMPLEIVPCEIVRAESGLALSSRNGRLTPMQREQAALIHKLISGPDDDAEVKRHLDAAGFRTEYVETKWGRRLAAAWLGDVRLIDNVPR
jgi:pantoate--beta-alanine ligase